MKAVWGSDYDLHNDKCNKCPACPECREPIFLYEDKQYHCVSCGKVVEVEDPKMLKWFEEREGTKTEMEDCFLGCGGKKCVEVHYRKNRVTLEWQTMGGHCTKCGMKFMV